MSTLRENCNMKKLTISCKNISPKQWSVLVIELNMIKEQWKPYANLEIHVPGFNKIIAWGRKKHDKRDSFDNPPVQRRGKTTSSSI